MTGVVTRGSVQEVQASEPEQVVQVSGQRGQRGAAEDQEVSDRQVERLAPTM